jgi:hypothetical protein
MFLNHTNLKSFLPAQRWFKITFSSCIGVVLSILFVAQLYSHLSKESFHHSAAASTLHFSVEKNQWASEILPLQIPSDPAQHSMFECSTTDDEMNDDVDDHFASSLMHDIPEDIYQAAYVDNFSIVAYTFPQLKSIPFFILYHAWKSNLV